MPTLQDLMAIQKIGKTESYSPEQLGGFETESFRFGKFLIEDDFKHTPEELKKNFWVFFDKELALSNFEKKDVEKILFRLGIVRLDILMSVPDFMVSFNDIQHLDQMEIKAFSKAMRSTGGINRERSLYAQQIRQFLTNEGEQPRGGILSRITGIFKGRR